MKKFLVILSIYMFSTPLFGEVVYPDIMIQGHVNDGLVTQFKHGIVNLGPKKHVVMVFNSPGGYVDSALQIISTMKYMREEGYSFECHLKFAASAAASIFSECDVRIAYQNSLYAQHKAGSSMNGRCAWLCTHLDNARVETEARKLNKTPFRWRSELPALNEPIRRWEGAGVEAFGLADLYYDVPLEQRKENGPLREIE